jgi:FkbM family methyltransferase
MKVTTAKLRSLAAYPKVFCSLSDMRQFRKLVRGQAFSSASEVPLGIKSVGSKKLFCRPKTTDAVVLWDTFYERYHLPSEILQNPKVILDLGANAGFTAAHFAFLYPSAKIIAVEMDSGNARIARRNVESWQDRCLVVNAAVWTSDGQIEYGGEEEWGFQIRPGETSQKTKTAPSRAIESLLKELGVEKVDYLKMDIEGAEGEVLKNSAAWIDKVSSMKIEIHAQQASYEECENILSKAGFRCARDHQHFNCLSAIRK